jgi:hypothetical protein
MITMTEEEVLLHIKKTVDKWDERFAEETQGNMILEDRRMWMWEECMKEVRILLAEIK